MAHSTLISFRLLPALVLACFMASPAHAASTEQWSASRGQAAQPPNPAASALLEEASQQLESGQLDQAAATLERALRIEPDNAATLHYLGQVRLQQGQNQQAEALAARSNTRAGSNADLRHRNARLISAAQQSMDSNNAPSPQEHELLALQQRLEEEIVRRREAEAKAVELSTQLEQERNNPPRIRPQNDFESGPRASGWRDSEESELHKVRFESQSRHESLQIPRGHRPPPGQCRIWLPHRPPGQQPPPGNCNRLQHQVPHGGYLVRG
jgi:tetratricopeptide (TPR) repeat protein